jgi:hypothetical protein
MEGRNKVVPVTPAQLGFLHGLEVGTSGSLVRWGRRPGLRVALKAANVVTMSTVQEIEKAIEQLPWPERLKVYRDLPNLIGRKPEDLDWQRAGLEKFFADDASDDAVYDQL